MGINYSEKSLKENKDKFKFVFFNYCEDCHPDLAFFVIEYSQNLFDLASF